MKIKNILLFNRAPFEYLRLDLNEDNISLLSGVNGTGKTTILSYIVDAFYELAKKAFGNEFEDKPNKFYRLSSNVYTLDIAEPSIVNFRFMLND